MRPSHNVNKVAANRPKPLRDNFTIATYWDALSSIIHSISGELCMYTRLEEVPSEIQSKARRKLFAKNIAPMIYMVVRTFTIFRKSCARALCF